MNLKELYLEIILEHGKNPRNLRKTEEFNKDISGWNYLGDEDSEYYQIRTLNQQRFVSPRDYLWPLSENTLLQNPNLVQNPGW